MGSPQGLINFYIVIYREMLKHSSSQELLVQFQPKAGNMLGGWGFRFVQIQGPNKGQNKENFDKSSSRKPPVGMH